MSWLGALAEALSLGLIVVVVCAIVFLFIVAG